MSDRITINAITKLFRNAVEKKYGVLEMTLFGSSARGDYSKNSDIDIMVRVPNVDRRIEEDLFNIAYDLELEYDCVIDVIVLTQNQEHLIPIYQNVLTEGVAF